MSTIFNNLLSLLGLLNFIENFLLLRNIHTVVCKRMGTTRYGGKLNPSDVVVLDTLYCAFPSIDSGFAQIL